eukprot:1157714-Pelagomonas_calceolata.AAC.2
MCRCARGKNVPLITGVAALVCCSAAGKMCASRIKGRGQWGVLWRGAQNVCFLLHGWPRKKSPDSVRKALSSIPSSTKGLYSQPMGATQPDLNAQYMVVQPLNLSAVPQSKLTCTMALGSFSIYFFPYVDLNSCTVHIYV